MPLFFEPRQRIWSNRGGNWRTGFIEVDDVDAKPNRLTKADLQTAMPLEDRQWVVEDFQSFILGFTLFNR
jgi:hypothetical protein